MSDRADALRYARELLDVTWRHGQAPAVADELETIVLAARDYQEQVRPLFHPLVPEGQQAGDHPRVHRRRRASASRRRSCSKRSSSFTRCTCWARSPTGFRERLNKKQGVVRAKVTTATALPADKAPALAARLSELTAQQVTLQTQVDPAIIGGVVTQIDSTCTTAA